MDVIRFHDWRYTYTTLPLKSGVDDLIVSKTLGHSTVSYSEDLYVYVGDDQQRNEINNAGKYFKKRKNPGFLPSFLSGCQMGATIYDTIGYIWRKD